jgi:hypothetical protein
MMEDLPVDFSSLQKSGSWSNVEATITGTLKNSRYKMDGNGLFLEKRFIVGHFLSQTLFEIDEFAIEIFDELISRMDKARVFVSNSSDWQKRQVCVAV